MVIHPTEGMLHYFMQALKHQTDINSYMIVDKNGFTKIRLLKSINHPKLTSLYKVSIQDCLKWNEKSINFKYHPEIKMEDIISVSKFVPGGLNFEPWIQIAFRTTDDQQKEIYISSNRFLGFGSLLNDNDKIENELKLRYINQALK